MPPALVWRGQYDFVSESNSLDVRGDLIFNGDITNQGISVLIDSWQYGVHDLGGNVTLCHGETRRLVWQCGASLSAKHEPDPTAGGQLEQVGDVQLPSALVRPPGPRQQKHNKKRFVNR
jgi:hypothetical protein